MKKNLLIFGTLVFVLAFGGGFFVGARFTERQIAQRPSFDKEGFVKSVTKTISGKVLEVKKDILVLSKNEKKMEIKIDPQAKITITKLSPSSASPSGIASPGATFIPPPETTRHASLSDIKIGDRVTVSVTETPDGKLLGRVVSVTRR